MFEGNVFIRTVTSYFTGRVERVSDGFVYLSSAAYIGDTGRFSVALRTGKLSEVEPFPGNVAVNIAAIVDISPWCHPLPTKVV